MAKILSFKPRPSTPSALNREKSHRATLLQYCEQTEFPAEQRVDREFVMAAIDRKGHEELKDLFSFFGVTDLDPSGDDFDAVLNTWFVLTANVGEDLRALHLFPDSVYAVDSASWAPRYRNYVEALWSGDRAAILAAARGLGIEKGVPEGAASLRKGPLPCAACSTRGT